MYIFLELLKKSLFEFINTSQFDENLFLRCFYEVVKAIAYMHSKKIVHRDIKPENVLMTETQTVKLCDFGFCASVENEERKTLCGTADYLPPEIMRGELQSDKVDVWCLGVLLYELYHRGTPFPSRSFDQMLEKIRKKEILFNPRVTPPVEKLILKCLQEEPRQRPSAGQLMNDPLFDRFKPIIRTNSVLNLHSKRDIGGGRDPVKGLDKVEHPLGLVKTDGQFVVGAKPAQPVYQVDKTLSHTAGPHLTQGQANTVYLGEQTITARAKAEPEPVNQPPHGIPMSSRDQSPRATNIPAMHSSKNNPSPLPQAGPTKLPMKQLPGMARSGSNVVLPRNNNFANATFTNVTFVNTIGGTSVLTGAPRMESMDGEASHRPKLYKKQFKINEVDPVSPTRSPESSLLNSMNSGYSQPLKLTAREVTNSFLPSDRMTDQGQRLTSYTPSQTTPATSLATGSTMAQAAPSERTFNGYYIYPHNDDHSKRDLDAASTVSVKSFKSSLETPSSRNTNPSPAPSNRGVAFVNAVLPPPVVQTQSKSISGQGGDRSPKDHTP